MTHDYLSTACYHEDLTGGDPGLHAACRRTCKFCDAPCACPRHASAGQPPLATVRTCDPVTHLWGLNWSPLASRTVNGLHRGGITTVAQLLRAGPRQLRDIRSFGPGCLDEARRVLALHGLALQQEAPRG
jgi:hypothetical protein